MRGKTVDLLELGRALADQLGPPHSAPGTRDGFRLKLFVDQPPARLALDWIVVHLGIENGTNPSFPVESYASARAQSCFSEPKFR
jgi:hypothetical protein